MMKRSSILLLLSMLAFVFAGPTACKSKAQKQQEKQEQRLQGAWIIDHDATIAQLPEDQQQMAGAFMKMMKIGIVFNEDETLLMRVSMMGQKDEQEGSYKILEVDENTITLELSRGEVVNEEGEAVEEEPSKMIVTFLEDNRISFKPVAEEGEDQADMDEETLILRRISIDELDTELDSDSGQPSLEDFGLDPSQLEGQPQLDADDLDADADAEGGDADAEDADAEDADDADDAAEEDDAAEDDAAEDAAE